MLQGQLLTTEVMAREAHGGVVEGALGLVVVLARAQRLVQIGTKVLGLEVLAGDDLFNNFGIRGKACNCQNFYRGKLLDFKVYHFQVARRMVEAPGIPRFLTLVNAFGLPLVAQLLFIRNIRPSEAS